MKASLQRKINLFYYNIFRFERFTQYLVSYPINSGIKLTGLGNAMARRSGEENWDEHILNLLNDPKGGISLNFAGMQVTAHLTVLFLSFLNFFCGLLRLPGDTFWFYGMFPVFILALVLSYYAAPTNRKKYLKDFKEFESMPKAWKRKSALLTFLIIIGVWLTFIASFVFFLRNSVS